jgi:WD40 repeat protein
VATGRKAYDLIGHSRKPSRLAFSPDGTTLAAGGEDGTVNRWDVRTGQRLEAPRWNAGPVWPVAFSPDGRRLACGDARVVQLIELEAGRVLHTFRGETPVTDLAFSPDGRILAGACQARPASLRVWNAETGAERTLLRHTDTICGLALHPAGRLAATASADATVRLWDLTPGGLKVGTVDFSTWAQPRCVAFTPQGRHLAVGLDDGTTAILGVPSPPEYTPPRPRRCPTPPGWLAGEAGWRTTCDWATTSTATRSMRATCSPRAPASIPRGT